MFNFCPDKQNAEALWPLLPLFCQLLTTGYNTTMPIQCRRKLTADQMFLSCCGCGSLVVIRELMQTQNVRILISLVRTASKACLQAPSHGGSVWARCQPSDRRPLATIACRSSLRLHQLSKAPPPPGTDSWEFIIGIYL